MNVSTLTDRAWFLSTFKYPVASSTAYLHFYFVPSAVQFLCFIQSPVEMVDGEVVLFDTTILIVPDVSFLVKFRFVVFMTTVFTNHPGNVSVFLNEILPEFPLSPFGLLLSPVINSYPLWVCRYHVHHLSAIVPILLLSSGLHR